MPQYKLFFSWQNDRKDTKAIIFAALNKAKEKFADEGIELVLDQDTRDRTGKRNIDAEVLRKIRDCDIFLADLTPAITYFPPKEKHDLPKHMPNSNVMYEYGYALHAKGENRMIVLASLNKEEDEHIEYMPFDINHDTITLFTDEKSLGELYGWIKRIMKDVDEERAKKVPKYDCSLVFRTDEGFSDEITIKPLYKKICYQPTEEKETVKVVEKPKWVEDLTKTATANQLLLDKLQIPKANFVVAKPMGKTINLSYTSLKMVFFNHGSEALDNLKISIVSFDKRITFSEENEKDSFQLMKVKSKYDTSAGKYGIFQNAETLNPHDSIIFDEVFVHVPHDLESFTLQWSLNSRQYQTEGELTLHVEPVYEYETVVNDNLAYTEEVVDCVKYKE